MTSQLPYGSLYSHGFVRVSVAVPAVRVVDVRFNASATVDLARRAHEAQSVLVVFPELGLTSYTADDLFHQDALLGAAHEGLEAVVQASVGLRPLLLVGMPLRHGGHLYNVAVAVHGGAVVGVVPKTYIPNYREYYEKRHFSSGMQVRGEQTRLCGSDVPFGVDLLFAAESIPDLVVHAEICEDLWVPIAPSSYGALAGATVLTNLSASNVTIGKSDYRRSLGARQSASCIAAYLYSAAGGGESSTDLAWDGDAHIHENGRLLAESERFAREPQLIHADVHLQALAQDRMRMTSFADNAVAHEAVAHEAAARPYRRIPFALELPESCVPLERVVPRFPYVPADAGRREERCYEAYHIQVAGLSKRLEATGIRKLVIGVSGGLDSTHALIVSCRAADLLGLPRPNVRAYTMPGFATSDRTRTDALELMDALGVTAEEIDIRPSCMQTFRDIGHPFADGVETYDVTFENVQAGARTSHLFRLANLHEGLVVGTGDLSELALGWATYGVGDHMSHYAVNASVPKTLIQYLIRWVADTEAMGAAASAVLRRILDTEISPELVPEGAAGAAPSAAGAAPSAAGAAPSAAGAAPSAVNSTADQPAQRSEETIGPYELQDFSLYYLSRYGLRPSTVAWLAEHAWADATRGPWPDDLPQAKRHSYSREEIVSWLRVFLKRFFATSQFKRSCIPNGPKVGSGGSLSPRGDWRAPSDACAAVWLEELEDNVPRAPR